MSKDGSVSVFKGALITVAMRWIDRFVGFISTLILARLLAPDDFGIIAIASVVVGLTDALLDLGVSVALINNPEPTADDYNTAWTLRLMQYSFASLIIFLSAHYAGIYFKDPRVELVMQVMSLGPLLMGLENIGIVTFQKEMRFTVDFRFAFIKRMSSFLATITAAWLLQSYWALVIGGLSGRVAGVILSYAMHSMRPRFSLVKMRAIFSVSQWMIINTVGNFLNHNLHNMIVGRRGSASIMGAYTLACDISSMPTTELLMPLNRVLFPALVRAKNDLVELRRVFLLAQSVQCLVGIPAGFGLALIAREAVYVLLGAKWEMAVPFVQILALAGVIEAITFSSGFLMITLDKMRNVVLTTWSKVFFFAIASAFIPESATQVIDIAWLRIVTMSGGMLLSFWMLTRALKDLTMMDMARATLRPMLGCAAMSLAIWELDQLVHLPTVIALILKIILGAVAYPTVVVIVWWMVGKPEGAESYLLEKFGEFRRKK